MSTAAPGAEMAGATPSRIGRLVVVGVGLIGGSFSLALKAAGAVGSVVGVGRRAATVDRALALGVIDEVGALDAATFGRADLVLLAMPVGQMGPVMQAIAPLVGPRTIITDAGSTKQDVVALAAEHLAPVLSRFVPGHPIAGTEHSGPDAAFATLYRDRKVVLAPTERTDAAAVALVRGLWQACGARVFDMPAVLHDKVFATVSHLPHLLAFSLVEQVVADDHAERLFSFAAGGFRDFTRIASSSPEMWRDICLANRDALGEELSRYRGILDRMQHFLDAADGAGLEEVFARAREARERWLKSS